MKRIVILFSLILLCSAPACSAMFIPDFWGFMSGKSAAAKELFDAIAAKDTAKCIALLKKNVSLNYTDKEGNSVLHLIAQQNNIELLKLLIVSKSVYNQDNQPHAACLRGYLSIDAKNNNGDTPLHAAARYAGKEVVELLLAHKADIYAKNNYEEVPLFNAVRFCNAASIEPLFINTKNHPHYNKDGSSVSHIAAATGNNLFIELVHKIVPDYLEHPNNSGATPLLIASQKGYLSTVQLLLQLGAHHTVTDNKGHTTLHLAVAQKNKEMIEFWSNYTDLFTILDKAGNTPLEMAIKENNREAFQQLYSHAKSAEQLINPTTKRDVLESAIQQGNTQISDIILNNPAHINIKESNAIFAAIRNNNWNMVDTFLKHTINLKKQDPGSGNTILHAILLSAATIQQQLDYTHSILMQHPALAHSVNNKNQTLLDCALHDKQKAVMETLIQFGAPIKQKAYLLGALKNNALTIFDLLLSAGADINQQDDHQESALTFAIQHKMNQPALQLLERNANINQGNKIGSPLHLATAANNTTLVHELLNRGALVSAHHRPLLDCNHSTLLELAISVKSSELIARFARYPELINYANPYKNDLTPLCQAITLERASIVEQLLQAGAPVNVTLPTAEKHPLLLAATKSNQTIIELLLQYGATAYAVTENQENMLHLLIRHNGTDNNFIEKMAKKFTYLITQPTQKGYTPFDYLIKENKSGLVQSLIPYHTNINMRNKQEQTALLYAASLKKDAIVQILLPYSTVSATDNAGNNILHYGTLTINQQLITTIGTHTFMQLLTHQNKEGNSPLIMAIKEGNLTYIKQLHAVNVASDQQLLHHAAAHGKKEIIEFFLSKGFNINTQDAQGNTPLMVAAQHNQTTTVKKLLEQGAHLYTLNNKQQNLYTLKNSFTSALQDVIENHHNIYQKAHQQLISTQRAIEQGLSTINDVIKKYKVGIYAPDIPSLYTSAISLQTLQNKTIIEINQLVEQHTKQAQKISQLAAQATQKRDTYIKELAHLVKTEEKMRTKSIENKKFHDDISYLAHHARITPPSYQQSKCVGWNKISSPQFSDLDRLKREYKACLQEELKKAEQLATFAKQLTQQPTPASTNPLQPPVASAPPEEEGTHAPQPSAPPVEEGAEPVECQVCCIDYNDAVNPVPCDKLYELGCEQLCAYQKKADKFVCQEHVDDWLKKYPKTANQPTAQPGCSF